MGKLLTAIVLGLISNPLISTADNEKDLEDVIRTAQIAKNCTDKKKEAGGITYSMTIEDGKVKFSFKYVDSNDGTDGLIDEGDYINLIVKGKGYPNSLRIIKIEDGGKVNVYYEEGLNLKKTDRRDHYITIKALRRMIEITPDVFGGDLK
ncbi:hypothetical protein HYU23_02470 [Candidatus Woesearchaeota archaeon]|nr:hypothetical protein [Candidatus Woesearchaeota archaeon]